MSRHWHIARRGTGTRDTTLAALAMATLLLSPLAVGAHHHAPGARPGDDAGCSACLWHSQHVAALVATFSPDASPASALTPDDMGVRLPRLEFAAPSARAPPLDA